MTEIAPEQLCEEGYYLIYYKTLDRTWGFRQDIIFCKLYDRDEAFPRYTLLSGDSFRGTVRGKDMMDYNIIPVSSITDGSGIFVGERDDIIFRLTDDEILVHILTETL